jgi:hypothetical protein
MLKPLNNSSERSGDEMETLITQRLVEMTFAPLDEVAGWLTCLGLAVESQEAGVLVIRNPYLHLTTALLTGSDPITHAVCLGFALAGPVWPSLCPHLLDEVNKEWCCRRRAATRNTPPTGPPGEKNPS